MNRKTIPGIPKYSLTAIAVLAIAMMVPIASTLAAPDCSDPKHKDKPVCIGGSGEGSITYTAELTGAFVFNTFGDNESIVDVTPNKRKSSLHSNKDLDMERPGSGPCDGLESLDFNTTDAYLETYNACQTWNHVFNTCLMLLVGGVDSVVEIGVGDDDWSIQRPGGVYVQFGDMPLQGAKVSVNLVGNKELNDDPFLPEPGSTSTFTLDKFATWGKSLPGEGGPMSLGCDPFENRPLGYWPPVGDFISTKVTLKITAEWEE
jgi:hypothetical protein